MSLLETLDKYIKSATKEQLEADFKELEELNNYGPEALEFLEDAHTQLAQYNYNKIKITNK